MNNQFIPSTPKGKSTHCQDTVLAEPFLPPVLAPLPYGPSLFVDFTTGDYGLPAGSQLSVELFRQGQPSLRFMNVNQGRGLRDNLISNFRLPLPLTCTEADLATFMGIQVSVQRPTWQPVYDWHLETLKVTTNLGAYTELDPEIFVAHGSPIIQLQGLECTKYWGFAIAMETDRMAA